MFRKLIRKTNLELDEQTVTVCYYETRTLSGSSRFSAEVAFDAQDHMILDADSVSGLETRLASLVHASAYSRTLVGSDRAA